MEVISSLPTNDDTTIVKYFKETLAPFLLTSVHLYINGEAHKLREIEFYVTSDSHPDPYTHCDVLQQQNSIWYFHKVGTGYKGGSYKGLDIAIGQGKISPGGVLIRSIESIESKDLICGPSLCVDYILKNCSADSIINFVNVNLKKNLSVVNEASPLHLKLIDSPVEERIFYSPRVGLYMTKRGVSDALQIEYCFRLYRALTGPSSISKGRTLVVSTLFFENVPVKTIVELTGVKAATVEKYKALYEGGKSTNVQSFMKSLTDVQLCSALGCIFNLGNAPLVTKKSKTAEKAEESEEEPEEEDEQEEESEEKEQQDLQDRLAKLKVTELKDKLKANKLPVGGTKPVLIERLLNCKDFVSSFK